MNYNSLFYLLLLLGLGCGSKSNPTIVSNHKLTTHPFPDLDISQQTVYIKLKTSQRILDEEACSGVVLSRETIITTAHCFEPYKGQNVFPEKVYFGPPSEITTPTREVEEYEIFPTYDIDPFYKDIAKLKIKGNLPSHIKVLERYNKKVEPGSLMAFQGYGGKRALTGFLNSSSPSSHRLKELGLLKKTVDKYLILSNGISLARPGDSGGPLFILDGKSWKLAGLVLENSAMFTDRVSTGFLNLYPFRKWLI